MYRQTKDGLILSVKVKPGSRSFRIKSKDPITIELKSPPEGNKANLELVKNLRKLFHTEVKIVSGFKNRRKIVLIEKTTKKDLKLLID